MDAGRRATVLTLTAWLAGCGGGGSSDGAAPAASLAGSLQPRSLAAQANGSIYPLYLYLPPDDGTPRSALPVVYLLDGESRFQTTVDLVEASRSRVILVGIGNEANRAHDYVPVNLCTPNGGGEGAFLDFIRLELIPYVTGTGGGHPTRRALLGHSHGGSFVLYALFAEAPGTHAFSAYLASDASIGCMTATVYDWDAAYASRFPALPIRLHVSYSANLANGPFVDQVASRQYIGLAMASGLYGGGHIGMIPAAFADAIRYGFAV